MNKFDDDKFSMTNVSLLEENISVISPRNLTSSPAPINTTITENKKTAKRSNENQQYQANDQDDLGDYNYSDKDPRAGTTSLKSQESVSSCYFRSRLSCLFINIILS